MVDDIPLKHHEEFKRLPRDVKAKMQTQFMDVIEPTLSRRQVEASNT